MKKNNKGFSLVELIIVIAIMAVLVAVLAPQYIKYVEQSRVSTDVNTLDEITRAVKIAAADPLAPLATGDYDLTVADGVITLTPLGTNVTNAIGSDTVTLKSAAAIAAAGTKITISIAADTYAVTSTLTYTVSGGTGTWANP